MNNTAFVKVQEDSGVPQAARDFSVVERVVIVTGGGQGIGRELARQFSAAGAISIVADLNLAAAEKVASEIQAAGGQSMAVALDIGDRRSVDAMVGAVVERFGRIEVLINNAGIFASLEKRPFDQIPLPEWDQVMQVNVTGVYNSVCAVAQQMRTQGWGRIVNISSDAVRLGVANYLHYVSSKSALIGMTASLARELGPQGITVNCVRPGGVATEVDRAVNPSLERRQQQLTQQCIPRTQVASDLVGLVLFLSTRASSFITGQTIACDGGLTHSS
ncbi:3-oxoacyl-[acyl-carrier protein] reductase [Comamonas sp. BIGb0124]|uniref:SDR family NAD(P)-dependent oxidoreductase n=1 Tax=Comamonas sp. BIGb0124 TaxID=2485130 RepID=UPI000F4A5D57|nr:SDR family NAD(P)-dependent oxidoreductase [Comamonas sp. BIGb0124]ROR17933.1 3-oxoacyl-[acyl-carrier protein] reductase [Comamonas sp. BIGb0124]